MKNKTLKKYSLWAISLLAAAGIALACVDIDWPDYPASYFAPETVRNNHLSNFFLSYHLLYNTDNNSSDVPDFTSINTDEWINFLDRKIERKDLKYLLYNSRLGELDTLIFFIKKPSYPINSKLKSNTILTTDKRKALDFLYYTGFARRCEPIATYIPDPWEDENHKKPNPRKDVVSINKLIAGGIRQVGNASSTFVRQRYIFQVVRLYFMENDSNNCVNYYVSNQKSIDSIDNSIRYRIMGFAAGAYRKQRNYAMANYLYSKIFNEYYYMGSSAFLSFHPQEESDWKQTLAMAKTTDDKIAMWEMLGVYKDPFRAMKEIIALNPKSDALDLMLVRIVNTEEQNFTTQGERGTISSDIKSTSLSEITAFLKNTADKGNTHKPYEWNLAAGYLSWLNNEKGYGTYLAKAKTLADPSDTLVQEQIRLVYLLAMIKDAKAGDKKFEKDVVPELQWISSNKHPQYFRKDAAYAEILNELATKYKKAGDDFLGTCFKGDLDSATIANNKTLNNVVAMMNKASSPFEKFAISVLKYSSTDLIDVQAVNLMYQNDFKGALAKYKEDANAGKDKLYGDPFTIKINDCHDCDATEYKGQGTKLSFVQKMVDLENKVQSNPKDAEDLFTLANGYYNMSYFGNNRVLYATKAAYMSDAGFDYLEYRKDGTTGLTQVYMSCAKAEEYYNKAMAASNDPEFKAKCCFMAAKCEQNTFFCNKPKDYKGDFKSGKYFRMLSDNFSKTKYYQEIVNECGYFKSYNNN